MSLVGVAGGLRGLRYDQDPPCRIKNCTQQETTELNTKDPRPQESKRNHKYRITFSPLQAYPHRNGHSSTSPHKQAALALLKLACLANAHCSQQYMYLGAQNQQKAYEQLKSYSIHGRRIICTRINFTSMPKLYSFYVRARTASNLQVCCCPMKQASLLSLYLT